MSFSNDAKKLLIVEAKAGKQLNSFTWVELASPYNEVFQTDWSHGEIVEVDAGSNGGILSKVNSIAECLAAAGSFYQDFFGEKLYIQLDDGSNPGVFISPDYIESVIAYVWKCLSNRQGENGETIDFIPEGCTYPHYYEPALRPGTLSELSATIADHFESAMQTSFGNMAIMNDLARWYADVDDWYWSNGDVRVRLGEMGNTYAQLDKIFVGKMKSPVVSDVETTFQLFDAREGRLQSIPPDHYNLTDYPSMSEDIEGQAIPILFGEKKNITPACINTYISPGGRTYKVSQTHFNSGADVFELESIDAIYHKGMTLSLATHYTVDLHNGEFTLLFDPGDGEITCDAKGIKDGFDFSASPFGAATGVYSENVADHLFFVLHILNGIPESELNMLSFYELQTARTQKVAWLLDQDTATMDFNRLLQQTSLYHFLPLVDGTFAARYYRKSVPVGTLELRDYDHKDFKKERPDDGVFRDIFLKYAKDPTTGIFKQLIHTEATTEQRYKTKESYTVETALRDDAEAAAVLAFYVALLKSPPTKIETSISMIGRLLIPTDKLYVNRKVQADGHEVIISADDVYVILEARKNLAEGRVAVRAQLDTQLAIYTTHADSPHEDVPHADHSDAIHEDSTHGDSHTDDPYVDHDDSSHDHEDVPHVDEYAEHEDHDDHPWPHEDGIPHNDVAHEDVTYSDHGDVPYADIPHVDTSHVDHDDTIHTDAHTDISHIDSEV